MPSGGRPAESQAAISDSFALVAEETAARLRLEAEVTELRARLDALEKSLSGAAAAGSVSRDSAVEAGGGVAPSPGVAEGERPGEQPPASERAWFDEASLLEAGFGEDEAAELRRRQEEIQMANLSLYNRARREGWLGTERFHEEAARLNQRVGALREELDEQAYDWFLYASHLPNRVRITGVFDDSPASEAGLQSGDVVMLYAGQRVFDSGQLVRQTAGGREGELVRLEIERAGEVRTLYVPRGPLGARIEPFRTRPPRLH